MVEYLSDGHATSMLAECVERACSFAEEDMDVKGEEKKMGGGVSNR